jgi:G3E family GTPase
VVDAEQIFAPPETEELKLRQIAFSDMLVLSKIDLVESDEIERIKAWLDSHFHRYRLIEARRGVVPLEILLSVRRFDPSVLNSPAQRHNGCGDPDWSYRQILVTARPVRRRRLWADGQSVWR